MKVYLAGFDVFRPDAIQHGEYLKRLCSEAGLIGFYPFDNVAPDLAKKETANWICRANMDMIRSCDIVMANLNDFRGDGEPDSGTAFEVGFAVALNKPVWGYRSDDSSVVSRVAIEEKDGIPFCSRGFVVEDFNLPVNLMLCCTIDRLIVGDAADCVRAIKGTL